LQSRLFTSQLEINKLLPYCKNYSPEIFAFLGGLTPAYSDQQCFFGATSSCHSDVALVCAISEVHGVSILKLMGLWLLQQSFLSIGGSQRF
jgi:hypothetical protein